MLKHFIQNLSLIICLLATSISYAKDDYQIEPQTQVVEYAQKLDQVGVLKQKDNGYLYLDVSNDFIAQILPLIEAPGKMVPPSHYKSKKGIGAHISVMYENEQIDNDIWEIQELGQTFPFYIKELRTVKLNNNGKIKKLWLLAIEAPDLELLRESYGLPSKIKGHDFHISIAYQIPGKADVEDSKVNSITLSPCEQEQDLEAYPEAA